MTTTTSGEHHVTIPDHDQLTEDDISESRIIEYTTAKKTRREKPRAVKMSVKDNRFVTKPACSCRR